MKRIIAVVLAIVTSVVFCACAKTSGYTLDYGESQIYTNEDIKAAAKKVVGEFKSFSGCVLYSLEYAGDEICEEELSYVNSLREDGVKEFSECLVFNSEFRSPINGGDAWEPNDIYTWSWHLGREKDGEWVLVTYGYP
ncbi:MAG: hypothetical protein IKB73_07840 [Ruminococcus sp.]|nr:hypothetical protein [Ruminococcus sp.]